MLLVHTGCHIFHAIVYWRITDRAGYSNAQLSGSIVSFREMYGYRISGIIDRFMVCMVLILLMVFGNIFGRDYVFFLYIYPLCCITMQISNFQSDFRNAVPMFKCCMSWYMRMAEESFDKAVGVMKKRDSDEKNEGDVKRQLETAMKNQATADQVTADKEAADQEAANKEAVELQLAKKMKADKVETTSAGCEE